MVMGCNDGLLAEEHLICTAASCTTNCLAPVVKVMEESEIRITRRASRPSSQLDSGTAVVCVPSHSPRRHKKYVQGRRAKRGHGFTY